ncbi:hypothetical protein SUNI508_07623 [Seiridium unicorne]|uniref:Uncharacterized protein n=1 Tax=Seiridium unicorne TaxID=138068 RepID=A0ABR2UWT9_9PEZI
MLIVLRHVFSFNRWDFRSSYPMQEAELKNPILRLAWQAVTAEPEYLSAQAKIASLFATKGQPLPKFRELLEHDVMISTLFSHPDLGLWDPQTWAIPPTAGPRAWHRDHVFTAKEVAQKSIVRWDGKENLQNCLEKKFGNLQTFSINVEDWHVEPGVSPMLDTIVVKYTLIAVVRMSSGPNPGESVRLYALNGGSLIPPASARISQVTSNSWRLGKQADSYILVYAKSTMPFRVPLDRTVESQAVVHDYVDRQGAMIDSLGDPSLDWVLTPSVSEREGIFDGETNQNSADVGMLEAALPSHDQELSSSTVQVHATATQDSQASEKQMLGQQPMAFEPPSIIQSIKQETPTQTGFPETQETSSHRAILSTSVAPESIGQAKRIHQPAMAATRTTTQASWKAGLDIAQKAADARIFNETSPSTTETITPYRYWAAVNSTTECGIATSPPEPPNRTAAIRSFN